MVWARCAFDEVALAAVSQDGKCAIISRAGSPHLRPNLVLQDYHFGYFTERRFAPYARLLGMCYSACSTRKVAALTQGLLEVSEKDIVTDFGIASTAAGYVSQGRVKITRVAHEKSNASPLGDALNFRFDRLNDVLPAAAICGVYRGLHSE